MKLRSGTSLCSFAAASLLLWPSLALHAQSAPLPVKPGLWEMSVSSSNATALPPEAEAKIAALPPAQQAQVRAMMSGGMGGGAKSTPITRQVCLAPQTSMDSLLSQSQRSQGMQCTFSNKEQTGHGASFDLSCTGAQGSAKGHAQYNSSDEEHMSSTIHMTIMGSAQGHTSNSTVDTTTSGKFLNADCGSVKPAGAPVAQ